MKGVAQKSRSPFTPQERQQRRTEYYRAYYRKNRAKRLKRMRLYNRQYMKARQVKNRYHPELMKTPYKPLDLKPVK